MKSQILLGLLSLFTTLSAVYGQGTAFTYQGRLNNNGVPAGGAYDLRFTIYDSTNSPGVLIAGPLTNAAVGVSNGLFEVNLEFGAVVFTGPARWLEISVRTNGSGAFTTLSPRQPLTPSPYAIYAAGANAAGLSGTIPGASIGGTYSNPVTFNNGANSFSGTFYGQFLGLSFIGGGFSGSFVGDGSGLINLNASQLASGTVPDARLPISAARTNQVWLLNGNAGTAPGNFMGTVDSQPVDFRVANDRVFRFEPAPETPNIVGGSVSNSVNPGIRGATIAGGGLPPYPNNIGADFGAIGGGTFHIVNGAWGTIAGGRDNRVNAESATVAGGYANIIHSNGLVSTIGGGFINSIGSTSEQSYFATIGGGYQNNIRSNGSYSVIAGGADITVESGWGTVSGGQFNSIKPDGLHDTIGGGQFNTINQGGYASTIGGGRNNNTSDGESTVAGGGLNSALAFSATVGGGGGNRVESIWSVIAGGRDNLIRTNASYITIAGGVGNQAETNANASTIGGGQANRVSQFWATVGGGINNVARYDRATIAGGANNSIVPTGDTAFIGGGSFNFIANGQASIVGGQYNTNNGAFAFIGGGRSNSITASGNSGAIPGGVQNFVSALGSFAAGQLASATHSGAFVWSDGLGSLFGSVTNNEFAVRAVGGVRFVTLGTGVSIDGQPVLAGSVGTAQLSGSYSNALTFNNPANSFVGTFSGNGGALSNVNAATLGGQGAANFWQLGGNAVAPGQFLGSTNLSPLEIRASNLRAVRLESDGNNSINITAGSRSNSITAGVFACVIAGGGQDGAPNIIGDDYCVIAGGSGNVAGTANGLFDRSSAAVGGGAGNIASGSWSTIPGGIQNIASGDYSFAFGRFARATNTGAFVWADSTGAPITSTNSDSVTMRASGGYRLFTSSNSTVGVYLAPGGGAFVTTSDRNVKENFRAVDGKEVLERVAQMPIQTWNYKTQDPSIRHLGPMAQDFKAAFGVGESDTGITTVDADGVALAAIQGLNWKLEDGRQRSEVRGQRAEARIQVLEDGSQRSEVRGQKSEARIQILEAGSGKLEEKLQQKEKEITELKQRLDTLEKIIRNQNSN